MLEPKIPVMSLTEDEPSLQGSASPFLAMEVPPSDVSSVASNPPLVVPPPDDSPIAECPSPLGSAWFMWAFCSQTSE